MELRDYQKKVVRDVQAAWDKGHRNVLLQLATGAGKTVVFSHIIATNPEPSIAIAHRVELVSQISTMLARHGVRHTILASRTAVREIVALHMQETGRSYYDPQARVCVAGVDTLLRMDPATSWFSRISLVVQDEGHHPLKGNKWGSVAGYFPHARGLYPTATPVRADGKGLGRHVDGLMDVLIAGPSMRDLISMGYLTEYRIFAPPSNLDLSTVPLSAGGDYSPPKLRSAVHKSHITGDVVAHYLRIARGKLGVTFAVDIESATEIAAEFRHCGVPAEVVSSKTPDLLRASIMMRFRNREILQVVNVDLLGEGVDVPAIEVVSMARPTQSYGLYSQQFGRALRPLPGKKHAIIIDHVNNVIRHGLPDAPRLFTLERRVRATRGTADDVVLLRTCGNPSCVAVYARLLRDCPQCGYRTPPAQRSTPEHVDGDLTELDPLVLARMRGEIERIDAPPRIPQHLPPIAQMGAAKKHRMRQETQRQLRDAIALWAGGCLAEGLSDPDIYRRFYSLFQIDVMSAQVLGSGEAEALRQKVIDEIDSKR